MHIKTRHIQAIGNELISLPTKNLTLDHIGDAVKSSLTSECYESNFQTIRKWQHPQISVHHFYAP